MAFHSTKSIALRLVRPNQSKIARLRLVRSSLCAAHSEAKCFSSWPNARRSFGNALRHRASHEHRGANKRFGLAGRSVCLGGTKMEVNRQSLGRELEAAVASPKPILAGLPRRKRRRSDWGASKGLGPRRSRPPAQACMPQTPRQRRPTRCKKPHRR